MSDASKGELKKSIRAILKDADLDQLSAKKIRKMLEAEYDADFTDRKEEIDTLVMQEITANESGDDDDDYDDEEDDEPPRKQKVSNGRPAALKRGASPRKETAKTKGGPSCSDDSDDDDSDIGEIEDLIPKKKVKVQLSSKNKKQSSDDMDDEELAKQLQDEGLRPSRRCKAQPASKKQRKPRKTSGRGNTLYSRPCALKAPLSDLLGTDRMPRPMIVKRLWEIVKQRGLLDPKNRQFMICDKELMKIFKKKRVRMFACMKFLKPYIKDLTD